MAIAWSRLLDWGIDCEADENIFISRWTIAALLDRVFGDRFKLFLNHPEEEDIYGYTLESLGRARRA
jgi:hypothetical protein